MGRVFTGLLLGLLVGLGAMTVFISHGRLDNRLDVNERNAVVSVAAAAQAIGTAWRDGLDIPDLVTDLVRDVPGLASVRVIDLQQKQLLASTVVGDLDDRETPSPLSGAQEAWYDEARQMGAHFQANRDADGLRQDEVVVTPAANEQPDVAMPIVVGGDAVGAVLASTKAPDLVSGGIGRHLLWLVLVFAATLVFWIVGARLPGRAARSVLALALLGSALWVYGTFGLSAMADDRIAGATNVRDHALAVRDALRRLPAEVGATLEPQTWDIDRFGQPRRVFDRTGAVDAALVTDAYAPTLARLRRTFLVLGGVSLLLAGVVALSQPR